METAHSPNAGFGLMVTLFPLVGSLIVQSQPRNRIGWVLNAIGVSWALTALADSYAMWALVLHPGSLPGAEVVVVVNSALWLPPILLMGVYLVLLFPDGHLPSPRWRILAWGTLAIGVCGVLAIALFPGSIDDVAIPLKENPIGVEALRPFEGALFGIILPLVPLAVLAAAVSAVLRYRRATGVARLQLKWLMAAGSIVAVLFALTMAMSLSNLFRTPDGSDNAVASFFQIGVDHVLRTDPHRHRDRGHEAQALRHRRADQPRPGGRGARRVRHRAVRRHRRRRRRLDRAASAVGVAVGPGDRSGGGAVPAGAGARAPARRTGWSTGRGPRRTRCSPTSRSAWPGATPPGSCSRGWRRRSPSASAVPAWRSGCAAARRWRATWSGRSQPEDVADTAGQRVPMVDEAVPTLVRRPGRPRAPR